LKERNETVDRATGFVRGLGLFDSVMMVAGSMIGSGIFIVSADIARKVGSAGWLLAVWIAAGALIVLAAASYGELAGMMPRVGGQYVYLKETYSPLWGFLFGWAMFLVIQSGTIAAVAVGFSRFLGVLAPAVAPDRWLIAPLHLSESYAVSLSTQQAVAIALIALLTWINSRGLAVGKRIQNLFTAAKTLALLALIVVGLAAVPRLGVLGDNLADLWTPQAVTTTAAASAALPPAAADAGGAGLLAALCLAMVGALFSSGAWNDVSFAAGEVRDPGRTLPRALILGTVLVTGLYVLANLAYLAVLPLADIQAAPDDRVATAALQVLFGPIGATAMAAAIVISTFGCANGLILAGARVVYAMARDGLFLPAAGRLNGARVPAVALALQGIWAALLVLPRTVQRGDAGSAGSDAAVRYGNLYGNLLEYVIFTVLIFYVLTIAGVFVLRRRRPDAPRPYRTFGYPVVPALYVLGASAVVVALLLYRTQTTWPGLLLVLVGVPVYFGWRRAGTTPAPDGEAEP
jgi:APA family basic amino acid/polyamine antiporter